MRNHLRQQGLSLIELLVAMALGLLITAGILNIVLSGSQTNAQMQDAANLTENGRYASDLLHDEIQLAGYYGLLDVYDNPAVASLPNPCTVTSAALAEGVSLPVQGYNDVTTAVLSTCSLSGDTILSGTDVLVTRRAGTTLITGALDTTSHYIQAKPTPILPASPVFIIGDSSTTFDLTKQNGGLPEDIRRYYQFIYYVNQDRELIRLELNGTGFTRVVIASGVENFQVDYGIDSSIPSNGAANSFVEDPTTAANWKNVVFINTHLLLRVDATGAYSDSKVYNLGLKGNVGPFNDGFKRRLFQSGNRIVNVSMKREEP